MIGEARSDAVSDAVTRAFRDERSIVLATLIRQAGDFQLAEDAVQDAFEAAVTVWRRDGGPGQSGGVDHDRRAAACDRSPAPGTGRWPTAPSGWPS